MIQFITQFGAEEAHKAQEATGGIAALGLNLQAFLFQLITFVIVLVILRKFVYKKLVATLDDRRKAVEDSLVHAAETEKKLKSAEADIAKLLADARGQAEEILALSHKEAANQLEAAETKAQKRADHIVKEAKGQMDVELAKARTQLKKETAQLVALATEQIIKEKLDPKKDADLIATALKQAEGRS